MGNRKFAPSNHAAAAWQEHENRPTTASAMSVCLPITLSRDARDQIVRTGNRSLANPAARRHLNAAAMLPPSTVATSAVVFSASAWARNACATSSGATSRRSRLPLM